jgi:nucleotide-binding universal stress UspA family protein
MAAARVRGDPVSTMYGTIVCGITETPEARAAAQLAAALAGRLGLRLVLVHVAIPDRTDTAIGQLAGELGDHVEARVVSGNRADGLASVAADEGADVIVLGSRPRGRRLCCALARELEAVTDVPVLIAPPGTRERSARRLALAELPRRG